MFLKDYGIVYKITSPSNKIYIGQTLMVDSRGKRRDHMTRFKEHVAEAMSLARGCKILNNAIRKYPLDQFKVEIITICHVNVLDMYETYCIKHYNSLEPNGYNVRTGGANGTHSEASRQRMSESKMGEKNYNYGKPRTDATKAHISEAKKGEKHHFYGKTFTDVHKQKLSKAHKKYDSKLPMYISYVKARPSHYGGEGYAVSNHPNGPNRQFTSQRYSLKEKLQYAMGYLKQLDNKNAVQRLDGDGHEKA